MTSNPNTNPTNADDTPPTPNRWAALDTLAFRVRSSWWAPWACATQAAFLAAFAYGAPQGEPGIALLPYAAAGLALAIPANTRRATRGLATLPAALRARRAYTEHAATPTAGLRGRASRLRRGMTGQTWRTPRIATITRGQDGALILLVENLPDIDTDTWTANGPALARRLRHAPPTVEETQDGRRVRLTFPALNSPPANHPTTVAGLPPRTAPMPDMTIHHRLDALPAARREDGTPWELRLLGNHVLVIGATGSGKGSVLWGVIRLTLPQIREGTVRLLGVDPKGGMELGIGRELFARLVGKTASRDSETITLLRDAVAAMQERAGRLYDQRERKFTPSVEDPLTIIVYDEFLMLYAMPNEERTEALRLLREILTQGRAVGFTVIGLAQDAAKRIIDTRDLFSIRVALRVPSRWQTDMTLGENATRDAGALSHEIPNDGAHQGVGYVIDTEAVGGGTAVRVRFDYTDDATILAMARQYPAPLSDESVVRGEIIANTSSADDREGEGEVRGEDTPAATAERPTPPNNHPTTNDQADHDREPATPKPTARERCLATLTDWPDEQQPPTVRELATTAGVSVGTASKALKEWREVFNRERSPGMFTGSLGGNFVPRSDPSEHTKCTSSGDTPNPVGLDVESTARPCAALDTDAAAPLGSLP